MGQTLQQRLILCCALAFVCPGIGLAEPVRYTSSSAFFASLDTWVVDTYADPGYQIGDVANLQFSHIHSDAHMDAVVGETRYTSTGFSNHNIVLDRLTGNPAYCAGCNGSFLLNFQHTSVGTTAGVDAIGLDYESLTFTGPAYSAFVRFANDTTADFALPPSTFSGQFQFLGLISPTPIESIYFGEQGQASRRGHFVIDNLAIGGSPVPEPATIVLLAGGMLGVATRRRLTAAR